MTDEKLREIQDEAGAAYMAAHSYDEDTVTPTEFNAYVAACRDAGLRAVYRAGQDSRDGDPEELARRFHETYERLAPSFGYETRKASAVPWADVPEQNKRLMIAVCAELFGHTTDKEGIE